MSTTPEQILKLATSFIGLKESPANSNNIIFNTHYYGREVSGSAYAWCAVFVWDIFRLAGASELYYGGNKTASCTTLMGYYKNAGQIVNKKDAQPGDIVFYNFNKDSKSEHVGIVESRTKNGVVAIEGNTSENGSQSNGGEVLRKTRSDSLILAVARPRYQDLEYSDVNYYCTVTAQSGLNCRETPSQYSNKVTGYSFGTKLHITKETNTGWGYTGEGWISLEYVEKIKEDEEDDEMFTYEQFKEYVAKLEAERAALDEPEWSVKTGSWAKATEKGIFDGTAPESFLRRDEAAIVFDRMGLIK